MDAQKLGTFIATVRKEKGMTQADLAKALNVTDKAVSKWERGLSLPDINNFEPLADTLGVSIVELYKSERLENEQYTPEIANSVVSETVAVAKVQKKKMIKKIILITVACISIPIAAFLGWFIVVFGPTLGMVALQSVTARVEVTTDIADYRQYGLYSSTFPMEIKGFNAEDFKYVYYNPFDEQNLIYLVADYDDETLEKELVRLKEMGIDDYKGLYSVTGINEKYNLLTMHSSDSGFDYAMQDKGNENRIIYVGMYFCNCFYDLKYEKYIPNEYLPVGFEAHEDNPYSKNPQGKGWY